MLLMGLRSCSDQEKDFVATRQYRSVTINEVTVSCAASV